MGEGGEVKPKHKQNLGNKRAASCLCEITSILKGAEPKNRTPRAEIKAALTDPGAIATLATKCICPCCTCIACNNAEAPQQLQAKTVPSHIALTLTKEGTNPQKGQCVVTLALILILTLVPTLAPTIFSTLTLTLTPTTNPNPNDHSTPSLPVTPPLTLTSIKRCQSANAHHIVNMPISVFKKE